MAKMWFVNSNNKVTGPFSTEEVRYQLTSGQWARDAFIWWKGQREWMNISQWEAQLSEIIQRENKKVENPVWYLETFGNSVGPLTQTELMEHLRAIKNLSKVKLWTVGLNQWTNIFDLHEIMDELGMSRRENERAPLFGTVSISRLGDEHSSIVGRAASVSVSGVGVNDAHGVQTGEDIQMLLKSPEFPTALHLSGRVVYVTPKGYAGIKFHAIHPETHSFLFDYVRRFNLSDAAAKAA